MSIFKKCFFYMIASMAIFGAVACSDDNPMTDTDTIVTLSTSNSDNLVGTWNGILPGGATAKIVISSNGTFSDPASGGSSVTFTLPLSADTSLTIPFTTAGLYYRLTDTTAARTELEGAAGAVLAGTLTNVSYQSWLAILQNDTNTAIRLTNTFNTLTASSFMVYPVIPVSIVSNGANGQITMQAYTSPSLFAAGSNAAVARATSAGIVSGFIAKADAVKNAALITYTKTNQ